MLTRSRTRKKLESNFSTNFDVVCSVTTKLGLTYTKYRSRKTGLTVILADIEAPLVSGNFVLATESFDDYGCPHTLEHLIFLGSEQYPYKAALRSLASRAISEGVNGWTEVDATGYTITAASSEGFLRFMPVFIDHILYPTFNASLCYTEVHHINGKGEDAGVVYSEMQDRQNSEEDRVELCIQRTMFPESCGYRYNTGGMMEQLREITVNQIRNYHKSYYRPDNLCLIITGKVKSDELMVALGPIEENIINKGPLHPMQRPWVHTGGHQDLKENVIKTVLFADEDETTGSVYIVWNGPEYHELLNLNAIDVLNSYLTESSVAVLQKKFVDTEDRVCTNIKFERTTYVKSLIKLCASGVPFESIDKFSNQLFDTLQSIVSEGEIDMTRMTTIIYKKILEARSCVENCSADGIMSGCISDFLYGAMDGHQLGPAVMVIENFEQLQKLTKIDWLDILKRTYLVKNHAVFLSKPSKELADTQAAEERVRINKRRADLGDIELAKLDKAVKKFKAANDIPLPKEVLETFEIPPVSSIQLINVITARNNATGEPHNKVQEHINLDNDIDIPLFIQFDHIKSSFVRVSTILNTSSVPTRLLPYTCLFRRLIFALPMEKNGNLVSNEEVVNGLNEDHIEFSTEYGVYCQCLDLIVLHFKAKRSKYTKSIEWAHDVLWNTRFTSERILMTANQILNDIPGDKRDAINMMYAIQSAVQNDATKSVDAVNNSLFQADFLKNVLKKLEKDPQSILADLNEYRNALLQSQNIRVHVIGDILQLVCPRTSFKKFCPESTRKDHEISPITLKYDSLTPTGKNPGKMALVVNLPSMENSYSWHFSKGPRKYDDPDLPPLMVLFGLLNAHEGIFWKLVRGQGLAYLCDFNQNVEAGQIQFYIYRSPNASKVFEIAKNAVEDMAMGKMKINSLDIDGAKSSVIYNIVTLESSMEKAGVRSFINQVLKQMPASHTKDLLELIQAVEMEDLMRVLKKYLVDLFHPDTSNVFVVSCPNKVDDICQGFEQYGFSLQKKSLDDIAHLSPFRVPKTE